MTALRNVWRMPWSTLTGACIGVLSVLAVPDWIAPLRDAYNAQFPVLRGTGEVVERDADAVVLRIRAEKLRGEECRVMGINAYAIDAQGRLSDAAATRIDQQTTGRVRDAGVYDLGLWRVRPVAPDAAGVKVVAQHDCVGRVVLSTLAEVRL